MTYKETFLSAEEHFLRLVDRLDPQERALYNRTTHVRIEDAFAKRVFYVYQIGDLGQPKILDIVKVVDFACNDSAGASTELRNQHGETLTVGYEPVLLFEHPVFVFLPLHCKVRWSTVSRDILNGSLAFPIGVRTMSRLGLREKGITYCETSTEFSKEFGDRA